MELRGDPHRLTRMRFLGVGILAALLLLSGCANSSAPGDEPSRAQAGATIGPGGRATSEGDLGHSSPTRTSSPNRASAIHPCRAHDEAVARGMSIADLKVIVRRAYDAADVLLLRDSGRLYMNAINHKDRLIVSLAVTREDRAQVWVASIHHVCL
jgi:hypothetical protein